MGISNLIGGIIVAIISIIGEYYFIINWDWNNWNNTFFACVITVGISFFIVMFLGLGIAGIVKD